MSKPEWGTKRTCQSCAAHFYDMRKDTIVCPKCGATYDPEAVLKSRRGRVVEKLTPVKPIEPEPKEAEEETETGIAAHGTRPFQSSSCRFRVRRRRTRCSAEAAERPRIASRSPGRLNSSARSPSGPAACR